MKRYILSIHITICVWRLCILGLYLHMCTGLQASKRSSRLWCVANTSAQFPVIDTLSYSDPGGGHGPRRPLVSNIPTKAVKSSQQTKNCSRKTRELVFTPQRKWSKCVRVEALFPAFSVVFACLQVPPRTFTVEIRTKEQSWCVDLVHFQDDWVLLVPTRTGGERTQPPRQGNEAN